MKVPFIVILVLGFIFRGYGNVIVACSDCAVKVITENIRAFLVTPCSDVVMITDILPVAISQVASLIICASRCLS